MDTSVVISVIIPALNEAKMLPFTLATVAAHMPDEYPHEIIVGDHGSTDATRRVANGVDNVSVLDCGDCRNVAEVRNTCALQANGLYYLFLDADISLTPAWAAALPDAIRRADRGDVVGSRPKAAGSSAIERAWFSHLKANYLGSAHMFMLGKVFWLLQGFDKIKDTGEDVAFCQHAEACNTAVDILPDMAVYHRRFPGTFSDFMERELWHGIGDWSGVVPQSTTAAVSALFVVTLIIGFFFPLMWMASLGILVTVTVHKFPDWFSLGAFLMRLWLTMLYMVSRFFSILLQRHHKRTFQW